jgi:hypothetical protein
LSAGVIAVQRTWYDDTPPESSPATMPVATASGAQSRVKFETFCPTACET